jgi:long-subunit acyl-CoA synthetase (AMP-forming)
MKKHILHEKQEFKNMRDLVERAAEMYGEKIAYSFKVNPHDKETVKVSFVQLRDEVRALASEWLARGLTGKHCALIGKFSYAFVKMYFSLLSIGAVVVPLDRDWHANDLAETVLRADAEYLFIDGDLKEKADVISEKCNILSTVYLRCRVSVYRRRFKRKGRRNL